jgi:hypothetical protein
MIELVVLKPKKHLSTRIIIMLSPGLKRFQTRILEEHQIPEGLLK